MKGEKLKYWGVMALFTLISGKYEKALEYYKEALIKREKVDDIVLTGNTLSSIGSVYFEYYEDFDRL